MRPTMPLTFLCNGTKAHLKFYLCLHPHNLGRNIKNVEKIEKRKSHITILRTIRTTTTTTITFCIQSNANRRTPLRSCPVDAKWTLGTGTTQSNWLFIAIQFMWHNLMCVCNGRWLLGGAGRKEGGGLLHNIDHLLNDNSKC